MIACDLPSPPTDFLTWRAPRHGYHHPVYEPRELPTTATPTVLWIMDTLDHLADVEAALGDLLPQMRLVICENLLVDRGHGNQRFHHRQLLREIAAFFR